MSLTAFEWSNNYHFLFFRDGNFLSLWEKKHEQNEQIRKWVEKKKLFDIAGFFFFFYILQVGGQCVWLCLRGLGNIFVFLFSVFWAVRRRRREGFRRKILFKNNRYLHDKFLQKERVITVHSGHLKGGGLCMCGNLCTGVLFLILKDLFLGLFLKL